MRIKKKGNPGWVSLRPFFWALGIKRATRGGCQVGKMPSIRRKGPSPPPLSLLLCSVSEFNSLRAPRLPKLAMHIMKFNYSFNEKLIIVAQAFRQKLANFPGPSEVVSCITLYCPAGLEKSKWLPAQFCRKSVDTIRVTFPQIPFLGKKTQEEKLGIGLLGQRRDWKNSSFLLGWRSKECSKLLISFACRKINYC